MIDFFSEDVSMPEFQVETIANWLMHVTSLEQKTCGDISVIFVSDDYLLEVNNNYLKHKYYTDVITFDYSEINIISGDIFISIDRVKENAESFNVDFTTELNRIMVHGVLHLIGYDDGTTELRKVMTELENKYLNILISK